MLFRSQWAKSYPFAQALEGSSAWSLLEDLKRATDPHGVINPGVLGLNAARPR